MKKKMRGGRYLRRRGRRSGYPGKWGPGDATNGQLGKTAERGFNGEGKEVKGKKKKAGDVGP